MYYVQTLMLRYYLIYFHMFLQINSIQSNQIELCSQKHAILIYTCEAFSGQSYAHANISSPGFPTCAMTLMNNDLFK